MKIYNALLLAGCLVVSFGASAQAAMAPTDYGRSMSHHESKPESKRGVPDFSFSRQPLGGLHDRFGADHGRGVNHTDLYLKFAALSFDPHHHRDFKFFFPAFMHPARPSVPVSPVPLPAALPLLSAGLLGLTVFRRRQNKA